MVTVKIYTDGSCLGNPGPGGWAALLISGPHRKEISGGQYDATTNNEMEMTAVYEALRCLRQTSSVTIYTDSQLVIGWLSLDWTCKKNPAVTKLRNKIKELWRAHGHGVRFIKVDGHSGHPENDLVDALAHSAAEQAVADHRRDCRLRPRHLE